MEPSTTPIWLVALLWSGLVSVGLVFGVFAGLYAPLKHRGITGVMAAGAGILIAAASLDLIVAAAGEAGRSGWGSHCSPAATHDSFPFNDLIAVLGSTCVLKPPKERDEELRAAMRRHLGLAVGDAA